MGEVYMWGDQIVTQDVRVEVSQDLLCIPAQIKGNNQVSKDIQYISKIGANCMTRYQLENSRS